jgi:transcriptional regulator with GAF, ATPase, and Fis domain
MLRSVSADFRSGRPRATAATILDTLLETELFEFEAGAFTDAKRARPRLFYVGFVVRQH